MSEFDEDTAVEAVGPDLWRGRITDRWGIGGVPNGGYVLAVGVRAIANVVGPFEPMTVTGHYLGVAAHAPVDVAVEVAKRGKRTATAMARMAQNGREHLRVLATFGKLEDGPAPVYLAAQPPALPPPDQCVPRSVPAQAASIGARFDYRGSKDMLELAPRPGGVAEISGWIRFADGRTPDPLSLVLIADAFPPPIFHVLPISWVPTLELTVHIRARPAPGWLLCTFRTRLVAGGLLDEEGEIWDEHGTLIAMSRQLARPPGWTG